MTKKGTFFGALIVVIFSLFCKEKTLIFTAIAIYIKTV